MSTDRFEHMADRIAMDCDRISDIETKESSEKKEKSVAKTVTFANPLQDTNSIGDGHDGMVADVQAYVKKQTKQGTAMNADLFDTPLTISSPVYSDWHTYWTNIGCVIQQHHNTTTAEIHLCIYGMLGGVCSDKDRQCILQCEQWAYVYSQLAMLATVFDHITDINIPKLSSTTIGTHNTIRSRLLCQPFKTAQEWQNIYSFLQIKSRILSESKDSFDITVADAIPHQYLKITACHHYFGTPVLQFFQEIANKNQAFSEFFQRWFSKIKDRDFLESLEFIPRDLSFVNKNVNDLECDGCTIRLTKHNKTFCMFKQCECNLDRRNNEQLHFCRRCVYGVRSSVFMVCAKALLSLQIMSYLFSYLPNSCNKSGFAPILNDILCCMPLTAVFGFELFDVEWVCIKGNVKDTNHSGHERIFILPHSIFETVIQFYSHRTFMQGMREKYTNWKGLSKYLNDSNDVKCVSFPLPDYANGKYQNLSISCMILPLTHTYISIWAYIGKIDRDSEDLQKHMLGDHFVNQSLVQGEDGWLEVNHIHSDDPYDHLSIHSNKKGNIVWDQASYKFMAHSAMQKLYQQIYGKKAPSNLRFKPYAVPTKNDYATPLHILQKNAEEIHSIGQYAREIYSPELDFTDPECKEICINGMQGNMVYECNQNIHVDTPDLFPWPLLTKNQMEYERLKRYCTVDIFNGCVNNRVRLIQHWALTNNNGTEIKTCKLKFDVQPSTGPKGGCLDNFNKICGCVNTSGHLCLPMFSWMRMGPPSIFTLGHKIVSISKKIRQKDDVTKHFLTCALQLRPLHKSVKPKIKEVQALLDHDYGSDSDTE